MPFHFIHSFHTFANKVSNLVYKPFVDGLQNATKLIVWYMTRKMEMELHFWQNYFDSHADSCRHCWYNVHLHVMHEMSPGA